MADRVVVPVDFDATGRAELRGAAGDLDRLGDQAARADRQVDELGRSSRAAGAGMAAAGTGAAQGAKGVGLFGKALNALKANVVIAGLAALYAAFRSVGAAYRAAGVQEIADNKLAQALRNVGEAGPEAVEGLKQVAAETQQVSNYGDEAIQTAQAMLLSFREVGGSQGAAMLTRSLVDTAAGMEKATGEARDLNGVAALLGRALSQGAGALTEANISLDDTQRAAFNAAEGLERVALLAQIVEQNYGGMAEATIDPTRQLENAVGDLAEQAGGPFRASMIEAQIRLAALAQNEDVVAFFRNMGRVLGWLVNVTLRGVDVMTDAYATLARHARRRAGEALQGFAVVVQAFADQIAGIMTAVSALGPVGRGVASGLAPLVGQLNRVAEASDRMGDAQVNAAGAISKNTAGTKAARAGLDALGMSLGQTATVTDQAAGSTRNLGAAMASVESGAKGVETSVDRIRQAIEALRKEYDDLQGVDIAELVDLENEKQRLEEQLEALRETVRLGVMRLRGELGGLDTGEVSGSGALAFPPIDTTALEASMERVNVILEASRERIAAERERMAYEAEALGNAIEDGLARGIEGLAASLGEFAAGAASFGDIGAEIVTSLGSLAQRVGSMMIAFGTASLGLRVLLSNPVTAIGAGAALVALGAAAKAAVGSAVSSATTGAATVPTSIPAASTSSESAGIIVGEGAKASAALRAQAQQVNVNNTVRLEGQIIEVKTKLQDLRLELRREDSRVSNLTGGRR